MPTYYKWNPSLCNLLTNNERLKKNQNQMLLIRNSMCTRSNKTWTMVTLWTPIISGLFTESHHYMEQTIPVVYKISQFFKSLSKQMSNSQP